MRSSSVTLSLDSSRRGPAAAPAGNRPQVITRFGDLVDVRNRGALKLVHLVGTPVPAKEAPAVVRLWTDEKCRELSTHQARALAAQLLEAARCAELQNT